MLCCSKDVAYVAAVASTSSTDDAHAFSGDSRAGVAATSVRLERRCWPSAARASVVALVVVLAASFAWQGEEDWRHNLSTVTVDAASGRGHKHSVSRFISQLYDPDHNPDQSALVGVLKQLADEVDACMKDPTQNLAANAQVPLKDGTLLTADYLVDSAHLQLLDPGEYTLTAIRYSQADAKVRAFLQSPAGWVSLIDTASFHRWIDKDAWPAGCPAWPTPENSDYIVLFDEIAITEEASAKSKINGHLMRNMLPLIKEVVRLDDEAKIRGKLSGGGWVTLVNLHNCEKSLELLPVARPPAPAPVSERGRRGSFLVVGDWGWDPDVHWTVKTRKCQETIALEMLKKFRELTDVLFVINVGDSFYPNGVRSKEDVQWNNKWTCVFHDELRSVPWYSVYGNHDLHVDPCACEADITKCAQINRDPGDLKSFYMPAPSYVVQWPEIDLEVVATDFNLIGDPQVCHFTTCPAQCPGILKQRHDSAMNIFNDRIQNSKARNLVMFSHYPTDYFGKYPQLIQAMKADNRHHILYLGGHRHSTDNTSVASIAPHESWVVGGGGGLSCDGPQGFLVGEIGEDYQLRTYPVMLPNGVCC